MKVPSLHAGQQSLSLPSLSYEVPPTPRSSVSQPPSAFLKRSGLKVTFRESLQYIPTQSYATDDVSSSLKSSPIQSPATPVPTPTTPTIPTPLLARSSSAISEEPKKQRTLSERFKRSSQPDVKRLRIELQRLLAAKAVRLLHARRRLRIFQGVALPFFVCLGYLAAGISLAILLPLMPTDPAAASRFRIICIVLPSTLFLACTVVGILLKVFKFPPQAFIVNFASVDYQHTNSLTVNLARLITDIDSAFQGTERLFMLELATTLLLDALETKAIYSGKRSTARAVAREIFLAPLILLATSVAASFITLTKSDEAPSSVEDGYEAIVGSRLDLGCMAFSLGCPCFMPRQRKFLMKVHDRSDARNAQDWSSIVLPV